MITKYEFSYPIEEGTDNHFLIDSRFIVNGSCRVKLQNWTNNRIRKKTLLRRCDITHK